MLSSLEGLAHCLRKYGEELRKKNKLMKLVHSCSALWRSLSKGLDAFHLEPSTNVAGEALDRVNSKLMETGPYSYIDLNDYAPFNPMRKYLFIKEVKNGLRVQSTSPTHYVARNVRCIFILIH